MNEPRPPANTPDEDALFAFGDDPNATPANDLEATIRRLQRATGVKAAISSSIPIDLKQHIWEDLMHAQTANPSLPSPTAHRTARTVADPIAKPTPVVIPSSRGSERGIFGSHQPRDSRIVRAVMRWQPAVSLAIVVTFLVGLIGIAYQGGVLDEPRGPAPQAGSNQAAPNQHDTQEAPMASTECVPHGADRLTTEELESMSLSDWPVRSYVPVQAVDLKIGQAALDTYLGWNACWMAFWSSESTPVGFASDEVLTYYSDRWQFLTLSSNADQEHREAFLDYWNPAIGQELIANFPLPLNRPEVVFDYGTYPTGGSLIAFAPGDVFQLPDGRYGVVTGTVSTETFRNGASNDYEGRLQFIAFVEADGTLLIDEMFPICVAGPDGTASLGVPALFPIAAAAQAGQPPANHCS